MSKKQHRDVWKQLPVVIEIGETEYEVIAQPLRKYIEFEEQLGELLAGLGLQAQPKEAEEQGEEQGEEAGGATVEEVAKGLIERGIEVVYEVLKCVIPDLEMDDVLDAPEPQLEHAINVCLRVNGGKWAETLIRDFLGPLVPALQTVFTTWLLGAMGGPEQSETPAENGEETPVETGAVPLIS